MPSLDLSRDYLLVDDPVTVTLYQKTGEGAHDAGTSVPYAYREEVTRDDVLLDPAILNKTATVFHLWKANLGGKTPRGGDRVADADGNWTAKRVERLDRDAGGVQRYRLTCVAEVS